MRRSGCRLESKRVGSRQTVGAPSRSLAETECHTIAGRDACVRRTCDSSPPAGCSLTSQACTGVHPRCVAYRLPLCPAAGDLRSGRGFPKPASSPRTTSTRPSTRSAACTAAATARCVRARAGVRCLRPAGHRTGQVVPVLVQLASRVRACLETVRAARSLLLLPPNSVSSSLCRCCATSC
jgi:hypothetical protein